MTSAVLCAGSRRAALLVLAGVLGVLGVAGCSGGSLGPPEAAAPSRGVPAATVAALDAAVTGLNLSRRAVLADAALLGSAATALDEADSVAATGVLASTRVATAAVPTGAAEAAARLRSEVLAYVRALAALRQAAAAPTLDGAVADSLDGLVAAGEAEAAAAGRFAAAAVRWSTYEALATAQRVWVTRRAAGWYRSESEAGQAYAVLTGPLRPELQTLRAAVAGADDAQARASATVAATIRTAATALDTMRAPPSAPPR